MDDGENIGPVEAYPDAAAILRDAGWKPHDTWNVYTRGTLVMGFQPGMLGFHVKDWAKITEGHPNYSNDTPDTAEEAAAWLVARFPANPLSTDATLEPVRAVALETPSEGEQEADMAQPITINVNPVFNVNATSGDSEAGVSAAEREAIAETQSLFGEPDEAAYGAENEAHGETGDPQAESGPNGDSDAEEPQPEADSVDVRGRDQWADDPAGDCEKAVDPIDADFTEAQAALDAHLQSIGHEPGDFPPALEGPELGAELLEEGQGGGDRFYMGDNLDTMRRERIGAVIEISLDKQAAIWAEAGTTEDAYQDLVSAVMHDTNNGVYTGPSGRFEQFTALQTWANRAAHVRDTELGFVRFLRAAERSDVEGFNPEDGWPE